MTNDSARLNVAVLLFDPKLPYSFSHTGRLEQGEIEAAERLRQALDTIPGYRFAVLDDHERLIDDLRSRRWDLALNFCDVGYDNDWNLVEHIPALLEMLRIPYTGSGPAALALSSDKALVRALALHYSILVPNEMFIDLTADPLPLPRHYPALIKPNLGGGSFEITAECVAHDARQARDRLLHLSRTLQPPQAIAQDFLTGPEYTVGVLGNPDTGLEVLPAMEVDYTKLDPDLPPVFTYQAKFDPESRYYQQLEHRRADLSDVTRGQLVTACSRLFRRLGFRDYARFDFRCGKDGRPRLLDANANPTWYWDSRFATMAGWAGHDYPALVRALLEAAAQRHGATAPAGAAPVRPG